MPTLPTPAALQTAMRRDGFAILRGLFQPSEVQVLGDAVDRLSAKLRGLPPGEHDVDGAVAVIAPGGSIARVVWVAAADPELDRCSRDRRLVGLAALVLGGHRFDQLIAQLHPKEPGDAVEFDWHQDAVHRRFGTAAWTDIDGRGSYLQTLLAIDACTLDNGPLCLVPGSHGRGALVHSAARTLPIEALRGVRPVPALLAAGDVAIFGPFVIHGSTPNQGDAPRRVLVSGFALPGANHRAYPGKGSGRRLDLGCLDPAAPACAAVVPVTEAAAPQPLVAQ